MKTVSEILDRAADLIEPEGAWTQFDFARNARGEAWSDVELEESLQSFEPTCFCIFGAVAMAAEIPSPDGPMAADSVLLDAFGFVSTSQIADWNDAEGRTQAEVVAKLREAAALARAKATGK